MKTPDAKPVSFGKHTPAYLVYYPDGLDVAILAIQSNIKYSTEVFYDVFGVPRLQADQLGKLLVRQSRRNFPVFKSKLFGPRMMNKTPEKIGYRGHSVHSDCVVEEVRCTAARLVLYHGKSIHQHR